MKLMATGKWILAGEHTVLRGGKAVVFPLHSKTMNLEEKLAAFDLTIQFQGDHGPELELLFWGALDRALELCHRKRSDLGGEWTVESDLPIGAGLGASAALTVLVGKICFQHGWITSDELQGFCQKIEDLFHGESSGVDVAVCLRGEPISFVRGQAPKPFRLGWKPNLFISYSGQRGVTKNCVQAVQDRFVTDRGQALATDEKMKTAVELCESALLTASDQALGQLAAGMNLAKNCFEDWQLTDGSPAHEMERLLRLGARAVKPTGSGRGGFILSLWDRDPRERTTDSSLISCF